MTTIRNSRVLRIIVTIFIGIPALLAILLIGYWLLNTDTLRQIENRPVWSQSDCKYSVIPALSTQFSPDGRTLAYSSINDAIYFVNASTGDYISETGQTGKRGVTSIAFSAKKGMFAYGGNYGKCYVEDSRTREPLQIWKGLGSIHSVVFSPDSKLIAIGSSVTVGEDDKLLVRGAIGIWNLQSGKSVWKTTIYDTVHSVAFSPDGRWVATGDQGGNVKLWDAKSGDLIASLKKQFQQVEAVAFSPDGRYVVGAGGYVNVWNVNNHQLERTLPEQNGEVNSIIFLPKSPLMALATNRGNMSVWNIDNLQKLKTFPRQKTSINSISCSPDGKTLASGSDDGFIKIWDLDIHD